MNSIWMSIIDSCCPGIKFYRDQKDQSSLARLRPDSTMFVNGAIFAKVEEISKMEDLEVAMLELCNKFSKNARNLFPLGSDRILGLTSTIDVIKMYTLHYQENSQDYVSVLRNTYSLKNIEGRVEFICDIIKFMRYVATIVGPQHSFHLIPDVRLQTTNGHHVTWSYHQNCDGLLKEFRSITSEQIQRINIVYSHNLENVEKGLIIDNNKIFITRIGFTLQHAIIKGLIARNVAFNHIKSGVNQLHNLGYAHCDIRFRNIFVDLTFPHLTFLNDLEYLTPLNEIPLNKPDFNGTAEQYDQLLLDELYIEIMK